ARVDGARDPHGLRRRDGPAGRARARGDGDVAAAPARAVAAAAVTLAAAGEDRAGEPHGAAAGRERHAAAGAARAADVAEAAAAPLGPHLAGDADLDAAELDVTASAAPAPAG